MSQQSIKSAFKNPKCLAIGAILGLGMGFGSMVHDKMTDAEWVVSPRQIQEAGGRYTNPSRPGTVTVLPIRSEKADVLFMTWIIYGLAGFMGGTLGSHSFLSKKSVR